MSSSRLSLLAPLVPLVLACAALVPFVACSSSKDDAAAAPDAAIPDDGSSDNNGPPCPASGIGKGPW